MEIGQKTKPIGVLILIVLCLSILPIVSADPNTYVGFIYQGIEKKQDITISITTDSKETSYLVIREPSDLKKMVFDEVSKTVDANGQTIVQYTANTNHAQYSATLFWSNDMSFVTGIIYDIPNYGTITFIVARAYSIADSVFTTANQELLNSGAVSLQSDESTQLGAINDATYSILASNPQPGQYGRYGVVQGKEGATYWKIYEEILSEYVQAGGGVYYDKITLAQTKLLRIVFVTTQSLGGPGMSYYIAQANGFKIDVSMNAPLHWIQAYPNAPVGAYSITIPVWLGPLGLQTFTISWANTYVTFDSSNPYDAKWNNYGPSRDAWSGMILWNQMLGTLDGNQPNDVGVHLILDSNVVGTYYFTTSSSVLVMIGTQGGSIPHPLTFQSASFPLYVIN